MSTDPFEERSKQNDVGGGRETFAFNLLHFIICTATVFVSVGLFLTSLSRDNFFLGGKLEAFGTGLDCLLLGWMGLLMGIPAWLANLPLAWTWVLIWFRQLGAAPLILATVALSLALSFLATTEVLINANGDTLNVTRYGPAYWLWLGSCGVSTLGCFASYATSLLASWLRGTQ